MDMYRAMLRWFECQSPIELKDGLKISNLLDELIGASWWSHPKRKITIDSQLVWDSIWKRMLRFFKIKFHLSFENVENLLKSKFQIENVIKDENEVLKVLPYVLTLIFKSDENKFLNELNKVSQEDQLLLKKSIDNVNQEFVDFYEALDSSDNSAMIINENPLEISNKSIQALVMERDLLDEKFKLSEDQREMLVKQNEVIKRDSHELSLSNALLKDTIASLQIQLAKEKEQFLLQKATDSNQFLNPFQALNDSLRSQLQEKEIELRNSRLLIESFKNEYVSVQTLRSEIVELQQAAHTVPSLKEQILLLQTQLDNKNQILSKLQLLEKQNTELFETKASLESTVNELGNLNNNLQKLIKEEIEKSAQNTSLNVQLTQRDQDLETELQLNKQKVKTLQEEITELRTQLHQLKDTLHQQNDMNMNQLQEEALRMNKLSDMTEWKLRMAELEESNKRLVDLGSNETRVLQQRLELERSKFEVTQRMWRGKEIQWVETLESWKQRELELLERNNELKRQIENIENMKWKEKESEHKARETELLTQIENWKRGYNELEHNVLVLKENIQTNEGIIKQKQNEILLWKEKNEQVLLQASQEQEEVGLWKEKVNQMHSQMEELKKSGRDLEKRLMDTTEQLQNVKEESLKAARDFKAKENQLVMENQKVVNEKEAILLSSQNMIKQKEQENLQLLQNIESFKETIKELNLSSQTSQNQIQQLSIDNSQLENSIKTLENDKINLQKLNTASKEELLSKTNTIEELTKSILSLQNQLEQSSISHKLHLDQLEGSLALEKTKYDKLSLLNEELTKKYYQLQNSSEETELLKKSSLNEIEELRKKYASLSTQFLEMANRLKEEKGNLESELFGVRQGVMGLEGEKAQLMKVVEQLNERLGLEKTAFERLQSTSDALKAEKKEMEGRIERQEAQQRALANDMSQLEANLEKEVLNGKNLRSLNEELSKKMASLQNQTQETVSGYEAKLRNSESQITHLSNQLETEKAQNERKLKHMEAQLKEEKTAFEAKVKNLENMLSSDKTSKETIQQNFSMEREALKKEIETHLRKTKTLEATIHQLHSDSDKIHSDMAKINARADQLNADNETLKTQISELVQEINNTHAENDKIKAACESKIAQHKEAKELAEKNIGVLHKKYESKMTQLQIDHSRAMLEIERKATEENSACVSKMQKDIENQNVMNTRKQKEIEELLKKLEKMDSFTKELKAQHEEELKHYEREYREKKEQIERERKEKNVELQTKLSAVTEQLKETREQKEELEKRGREIKALVKLHQKLNKSLYENEEIRYVIPNPPSSFAQQHIAEVAQSPRVSVPRLEGTPFRSALQAGAKTPSRAISPVPPTKVSSVLPTTPIAFPPLNQTKEPPKQPPGRMSVVEKALQGQKPKKKDN